MGLDCITGYFPGMDSLAKEKFQQLYGLYNFWNEKINVISRKDLSNLYINHVLHSLSLAKVIPFSRDEKVLDIGTGGGFPGIPLAILFPRVYFTLIDSTGKKIKVVDNIAGELKLTNVITAHARVENFNGLFHYTISRAVCSFSRLVELSAGKFTKERPKGYANGVYSLKGGELKAELAGWEDNVKVFPISNFFREEFFRTKSIVFLPAAEILPEN